MNGYEIIYPMLAMVVLTFMVLVALFRSRVKAVREGQVSGYYFKTYQDGAEPELSAKLSRQFSNIFESPTLFYVVCLAALATAQSTSTFQLMAWSYVILRVAHAYIHTGKNKIRPRLTVYFASWVVLLVMWAYLAIRISIGL